MSGENTNNQEIGAADRPQLFQEDDRAEAREVFLERGGAGAGAGVDWLAWTCEGSARLFERANERGACRARGGMRGVPCANGWSFFRGGQRDGLFKLP